MSLLTATRPIITHRNETRARSAKNRYRVLGCAPDADVHSLVGQPQRS